MHSRPGPKIVLNEDVAALELNAQIARMCGGKLTFADDEEPFSFRLALPVVERFPVLAIDDNVDTLQLLHRYTSSTRYRLIGTRDPAQALSLAVEFSPQIIVLDVMMPDVDGWEVLGQLRHHALTAHIPIVICTILAQEELALSLGADTFVRKPISQETFLSVLDCLAAKVAAESC